MAVNNAAVSAQDIPPMPTRRCPFRIYEAHEVHPLDNVDWTFNQADWDQELRDREHRNHLLRDHLLEGKTAQYRSSGNSLFPDVHSGDCCMYEPVTNESLLKEGDIVFCLVLPKCHFYAHKILKIRWVMDSRWKVKYWIGNNKGHVKGYCFIEHIYGRLFEVAREWWSDE